MLHANRLSLCESMILLYSLAGLIALANDRHILIFVCMEDFSTLVYIAAGILYLIIRALSGKKNKNAPQQGGQQQERKRAPKSFEELLQEFSDQAAGGKSESTQPASQSNQEPPRPRTTYKRAPLIEDVNNSYDDAEALARYERSVQMAQQSHSNKDIYSAISKLERGRMGSYKMRKKKVNKELARTRKLLKNPSNLSQAIILIEIIDRKY